MSKVKPIRIAAIMLVVVLLTACIVSGTLAKYTTSAVGTASAELAEWGVTLDTSSFKIVNKAAQILKPNDTHRFQKEVSMTGTPETPFKVMRRVTTLNLNNFYLDGAFYCPLIFQVVTENGTEEINCYECTSEAEVLAKINAALAKADKQFAAKTNLSTLEATKDYASLGVRWRWERGSTPEEIAENDVKDTRLTDAGANLNIEVTTTVEQIKKVSAN